MSLVQELFSSNIAPFLNRHQRMQRLILLPCTLRQVWRYLAQKAGL